MRKRVLIILTILVLGTSSTFLIIKNNKVEVEFKYVPLYDGVDLTYKFTASSKHFAIETGEAYYNDGAEWYRTRALYINNFKLIKEIKNLKSYSLDVRFYDLLLTNNEEHYQGKEDIKDFLSKAIISYGGNGVDPFLLSKEHEFKDNLKISIKYCLNNDKCFEEDLNIKYID